jgi:hypothetical protein
LPFLSYLANVAASAGVTGAVCAEAATLEIKQAQNHRRGGSDEVLEKRRIMTFRS